MKVQRMVTLGLVVTVMTAGLAEARGRCGNGEGRGRGSGRDAGLMRNQPGFPAGRGPERFEKESLTLMRQEEKLARDVYLTLGENYDLPVFTNIPRSEQRHMDQMGELLDATIWTIPSRTGSAANSPTPRCRRSTTSSWPKVARARWKP